MTRDGMQTGWTAADLARWRTALMHKGMGLNQALTTLLAGQNVTLATLKLPHEQKPGEKPEARLRRYLDQVSRAQKRLGTPGWGLCRKCGMPLPLAVLDEAPWTEDCAACGD